MLVSTDMAMAMFYFITRSKLANSRHYKAYLDKNKTAYYYMMIKPLRFDHSGLIRPIQLAVVKELGLPFPKW